MHGRSSRRSTAACPRRPPPCGTTASTEPSWRAPFAPTSGHWPTRSASPAKRRGSRRGDAGSEVGSTRSRARSRSWRRSCAVRARSREPRAASCARAARRGPTSPKRSTRWPPRSIHSTDGWRPVTRSFATGHAATPRPRRYGPAQSRRRGSGRPRSRTSCRRSRWRSVARQSRPTMRATVGLDHRFVSGTST